ncbi:DUF6090 family protein [Fulvivirga lutea]|uniref:Uncharacterized protein n=1 Tax=Fulvivirga lutea TaxID=2810512 RepID=A0A974WI51_9BACT|nr:DUF6090 family protein [Fulvivirga lutea]QSE98851.1 hypothetical protein JR347_07160 [Fulvivirga lutea]
MINFFRALRKDSSADKNIGMYLAYALGEIVLVVIGILIALQVDNWNKENENREKERKYLSEIRTNLQEDLRNIDMVFSYNKGKTACINNVLNDFGKMKNTPQMVVRFSSSMDTLSSFEVFNTNKIAFQNLMSSASIDLIQNDSLRTLLPRYYNEVSLSVQSGTQQRVAQSSRKFVDEVGPHLMNRDMLQRFFNVEIPIKSITEVNLANNELVVHDLFFMERMIVSQNAEIKQYREDVMQLIAIINAELE